MISVRYCEALREKAQRYSFVYKEARLKRIFIDGLQPSIRFSLRTCRRAQNDATSLMLVRRTTPLVKLREDAGIPASSTREVTRSQPGSFWSSQDSTKTTPLMFMEEAEHSLLSLLEGKTKKELVILSVKKSWDDANYSTLGLTDTTSCRTPTRNCRLLPSLFQQKISYWGIDFCIRTDQAHASSTTWEK